MSRICTAAARRIYMLPFVVAFAALTASAATAQGPTPYGTPITLDKAAKVMKTATEEANKNEWPVAIAIYDSTGHLVMFHRLDNTQIGSVEIAMEKAKAAVIYRRSTKVWEDLIAEGGANLKLLKLPGVPFEGGLPIIVDGKLVGGIGVSGVTSAQDGQIAAAGVGALEGED